MISKIDCYDMRLPLRVPSGNSLGVLTEFTSIIAIVTDENGKYGMGEGTPAQPGYQHETPEGIWEFVCEHSKKMLGLSVEQAHDKIMEQKDAFPFGSTIFLTALEEIQGAQVLTIPKEGLTFPLVGIVNPPKGVSLEDHLEQRLEEGYKTLKVKVGFGLEGDIEKVKKIQKIVGERALLRLDANQAYSFEEAYRFTHEINPFNIELLEQPFEAGIWEPMQRLAKDSPLPLMLDESIFNKKDVIQTGELQCAQYIKFKLMKSASAVAMTEEMQIAGDYGIKVLIGNGVAADIGCLQETLIGYHANCQAAGEQNGYLKPTVSLFSNPCGFENGNMVIPPNYHPVLDEDVLKKYSRAEFHVEY